MKANLKESFLTDRPEQAMVENAHIPRQKRLVRMLRKL